jgi:voltage-gated potassium channel
MPQPTKSKNTWRQKLFTIVFEADTKAGRIFDISLLLLIVLSIVIVMLESIPGYKQRYGDILYRAEWLFTILFTIEYILRLLAVKNPVKYATSF